MAPTLRYFNVRARAGHIRLALALAGVEYNDERPETGDIKFGPGGPSFSGNWKDLKDKQPLKQLPVWEEDGLVIPQSVAILQHVGRKHGLYGASEAETAEVDVVVHFLECDVAPAVFSLFGQFDNEQKLAEVCGKIAGYLSLLAKRLEGRTWAAGGDKPTIADAALFHWLYSGVHPLFPEVVEAQPGLKTFAARFALLDGVKQYLASDKFAPVSAPPQLKPLLQRLNDADRCRLPAF